MSKEYLKSFIFWRRSAKNISPVPPFPTGRKLSLRNLDFHQGSDPGVIPSYVQYDPDLGYEKDLGQSDFYERLLQEAPLIPAEFHRKQARPLPSWFDKDQLRLGLDWVGAHSYSIFLAHVLSLFLIVTIRPLQALLLRTTPFHNTHQEDGQPSPSLLFTLKTVLKIRNVYEELRLLCTSGGNWEVTTSPGAEIREVREVLRSASQNFKKFLPPLSTELSLNSEEMLEFMKLRQGLASKGPERKDKERIVEMVKTTRNPVVPLSQYDLAILQFSLCGLPALFPQLFGIKRSLQAPKEAQAFSHVWALIGHSIGLRDEFNFALLHTAESATSWKSLTSEVLDKIFKFSFTQMDPMGFKLWILLSRNLTRAGFGWILLVQLEGILHVLSRTVLGIPLDTLGWRRRLNYYAHRLLVQTSKGWITRVMLNGVLRGIMGLATWYYISRHAKKQRNEENELSTSRMSLTRSIRWSSKEDGIVFDVV